MTRTLVRALSTISTSPSESESEYSDMSSAPLLDYPSGICVVFRVLGVETRIAFGAF